MNAIRLSQASSISGKRYKWWAGCRQGWRRSFAFLPRQAIAAGVGGGGEVGGTAVRVVVDGQGLLDGAGQAVFKQQLVGFGEADTGAARDGLVVYEGGWR